MESYSTIAKAFILLVVSIYSVYARECKLNQQNQWSSLTFTCYDFFCIGSIQGLPSSAFRRGDIYFLEFRQESSVKITLECRCSAYFPIWNHYKMNSFDTDTISDFDQVKCRKDGKDCSRKFINPKVGAPGFYVYRKTTFLIDEPSVLTCSSTKNKEMVIISVKQGMIHNYTIMIFIAA